jgi:hypothetical protein
MKNESIMESQRKLLAKEEIKNMLMRKGWTNRSLAEWWGCSEEYVSKIVNNNERRRWFDDAIRGLPNFVNFEK